MIDVMLLCILAAIMPVRWWIRIFSVDVIIGCIPAAIIIIPLVLLRIKLSLYGSSGDGERLFLLIPCAFIVSGVLNLAFLMAAGQEKDSAEFVIAFLTLLLHLGLLLWLFLWIFLANT